MLLFENGIVLITADGERLTFSSEKLFERYCPPSEFKVRLGKYEYIDYAPEAGRYFVRTPGGQTINMKKNIPNARFDGLIAAFATIKSRVDDPYYGLSDGESRALALSLLEDAYQQIKYLHRTDTEDVAVLKTINKKVAASIEKKILKWQQALTLAYRKKRKEIQQAAIAADVDILFEDIIYPDIDMDAAFESFEEGE